MSEGRVQLVVFNGCQGQTHLAWEARSFAFTVQGPRSPQAQKGNLGSPPPACPAADHLVLRSVPGHHAAQVGADGVDACGMCGNTKQCLCCFLRGGMLARLLAAAIRSRHDCIRHSGCVPYFSRPISPTTRYVGSPCIRHRQRQCNALGHDTGAAGALVVSSGG